MEQIKKQIIKDNIGINHNNDVDLFNRILQEFKKRGFETRVENEFHFNSPNTYFPIMSFGDNCTIDAFITNSIYNKNIITLEEFIKRYPIEEQADKEETAQLGIGAVIGWVSVSDELPKEYKHRMSRDVLTIAGSKMSVKSYDWELGRWNGSPHITVTHWMELPSPPCR